MDIFHAWEPIALDGTGWHSREIAHGEAFRWVGPHAFVTVAQMPGLSYDLSFDVEAGPAVGSQTFDLVLYDVLKKAVVATKTIAGRDRVTFHFPIAEPCVHRLELRCENGSTAIAAPGDTRTLLCRVFAISVIPLSNTSGRATELEARIRELEAARSARDEIIERNERGGEQFRTRLEALQRDLEKKELEIERYATLAKERLAVIRALHDQEGRATG